MRSFEGKLRLADRPTETMGAGIEVAAGSMSLIISDQAVAAWPLERVDIEVETDGFHFIVDGEEFIFVTRDASGFAEAVGLLDREAKRGSTRTRTLNRPEPQTGRREPEPDAAVRPSTRRWEQVDRAEDSDRVLAQLARARERAKIRNSSRELSRRTQLGIAVLVLALVLGIFAKPLLAFLLMAGGSIGLLIGTGAMVDPIVATRLPEEITAGKAVMISVVLLLTGMLVLAI